MFLSFFRHGFGLRILDLASLFSSLKIPSKHVWYGMDMFMIHPRDWRLIFGYGDAPEDVHTSVNWKSW